MNINDLNQAVRAKSVELEVAIGLGKPHQELLVLYKQLKELQFRLLQAEIHNSDSQKVA